MAPALRLGTNTVADCLLEIGPRAPFRLDLTAWALRRRPHNAIDRWHASSYRRVVCVDGGPVGALGDPGRASG